MAVGIYLVPIRAPMTSLFLHKLPTNALTVYVNTSVLTLLHSYMFRPSGATFREY